MIDGAIIKMAFSDLKMYSYTSLKLVLGVHLLCNVMQYRLINYFKQIKKGGNFIISINLCVFYPFFRISVLLINDFAVSQSKADYGNTN
jgi:hypothetical protein